MALATGTIVRTYGALDESATDELLIPHLNAARRELRQWVGASVYAAAEAAAEGVALHDDLVEAEAFLAYSYAIEFIGIRHMPEGFSVEGQVGDRQYRYLSPGQIKTIQGWARERARRAAEQHISSATRFHLGSSPAAEG